MTISVKRATLENLNVISELFNSYRVFYKQDSNLDLAVNFISERMKNNLYVSKDARRLGVGKKLMEAARVFAVENNSKGISLETASDNVNAQALYESLGYERDADVYNYFLNLKKA